jgi:hypothetical protein
VWAEKKVCWERRTTTALKEIFFLLSQLISLVFYARAFQTAKQCNFFLKKLYTEVTLENHINLFFLKK